MSCGYADRLKKRDDYGGTLGTPEIRQASCASEVAQLAATVREAQGAVVLFTGAGLSTSCGIPDFRGPNGVWTREKQGMPKAQVDVSFVSAVPSIGHAIASQLVALGHVSRVVSQNVDGLHLRSGIPANKLTELHGNTFVETCEACNVDHVRDFEVETVGYKRTGRACSRCSTGVCRDFVLDWDSAIREADIDNAHRSIDDAKVVITLGTSLQITPACNMPQRCHRKGGKVCIVNLQKTPKDKLIAKKDGLRIFATCDEVMCRLHTELSLPPIPDFVRSHGIFVGIERTRAGAHVVYMRSAYGAKKCPLPWLDAASFVVRRGGTDDIFHEEKNVRAKPSGSGVNGRGNGEPRLFFSACAPLRTTKIQLGDDAACVPGEIRVSITLHLLDGSTRALPDVRLHLPLEGEEANDTAAAPAAAAAAPEAVPDPPAKRARVSVASAAIEAASAAAVESHHSQGLDVSSSVAGWRAESDVLMVETQRKTYDPASVLGGGGGGAAAAAATAC